MNHMAWMMHSLDDLKELYLRLIEKGVPIERVGDHGVSIGIYLKDPDGNGVEVGYELPRSEWPRQDNLFVEGNGGPGMRTNRRRGSFTRRSARASRPNRWLTVMATKRPR